MQQSALRTDDLATILPDAAARTKPCPPQVSLVPYVMFAIKKTQILIEFLDRTQKSFLVAEIKPKKVS